MDGGGHFGTDVLQTHELFRTGMRQGVEVGIMPGKLAGGLFAHMPDAEAADQARKGGRVPGLLDGVHEFLGQRFAHTLVLQQLLRRKGEEIRRRLDAPRC